MRGPIFYTLVKARVRRQLRLRGVGYWDLEDAMEACDEDLIDVTAGPPAAAAIGDGHIVDAILEFLRSEQGQALIAALVKALLALLAV